MRNKQEFVDISNLNMVDDEEFPQVDSYESENEVTQLTEGVSMRYDQMIPVNVTLAVPTVNKYVMADEPQQNSLHETFRARKSSRHSELIPEMLSITLDEDEPSSPPPTSASRSRHSINSTLNQTDVSLGTNVTIDIPVQDFHIDFSAYDKFAGMPSLDDIVASFDRQCDLILQRNDFNTTTFGNTTMNDPVSQNVEAQSFQFLYLNRIAMEE